MSAVVPASSTRTTADAVDASDANGLSALSLLAPARSEPRVAVVSTGIPETLPFSDRSLDVLIIDLDCVPVSKDAALQDLSREIRRVLADTGVCVAAVCHRRRARNPRALHRYQLLPPSRAWRSAFRAAGLTQTDAALISFDGDRLTTIVPADPPCTGEPTGPADSAALVLTPSPAGERRGSSAASSSVLGTIVSALRGQLRDQTLRLDRVLVRKIGKTACSLSGTDARRLMVRIPRSNIALRRAQRNHLALERLHGAEDRWQGLRPLIPGPVAAGRAGDYAYFAETVVPGRPREMRVNALVWEPQALDAIVGMHRASRAAACVDEEVFSQHLGLALDEITAALADPVEHATLDRLRARLWTDLRERQLPMVSAHGDFTGENCLYDGRGRLSGIIDWELFKPAGFPVLDLLQCMDIPGEADSRESWLRCELVFDAVQRRGAVHDSPVLHRYVDELGVPSGLLPALLLAYWVDHVGARIAARGTDRAWMNKRVHGPLRRLARLL